MTSISNLSERLTWLLYTDVNTRLNLVMDECLHLEQTIHGLFGDCQGEAISSYDPMRSPEYYFRNHQDRALEHLRRTIYGLRKSLEKNKEQVRQAYRQTLPNAREGSESLFWFISLRGHFLYTVLDRYLEHLQHAHEKLVQILENMPSVTPSPTLLRRWSSGGYGEFLSEYSRSVNWEIQKLFWAFCGCSEDNTLSFGDWRSTRYLVHNWSHQATSTTRILRTQLDNDSGGSKTMRYTTIWSSYFYLELPILLPLLYHECAHHLSNGDGLPFSSAAGSNTERRRKLWLDRPREAAGLLNRLIELEVADETFWSTFVQEIWADAVSIALCGKGFLSALTLQIVGLPGDGGSVFSDYDYETDDLIRLDQIGTDGRRVWPIPYIEFSSGYFWEARLQVAIKAYRCLHGSDEDGSDEWIEGITAIVQEWYASGSEAMSSKNVSAEHETHWRYRKDLNDWAANVIWAHLREFTEELKSYPLSNLVEAPRSFDLNEQAEKVIQDAFGTYLQVVFPKSNYQLSPSNRRAFLQLEDVCIYIQWFLSAPIIKDLLPGTQDGASESFDRRFSKWAGTFADYMRSDGSVAFRIGIEWIGAVHDVYRSAGSFLWQDYDSEKSKSDLTDSLKSIPDRDHNFAEIIRNAIALDFDIYAKHRSITDDCRRKEAVKTAERIARKQDISQTLLRDGFKATNLKSVIGTLGIQDLLSEAFRNVLSQERYIQVGTFTLGVVRPSYVGDPNPPSTTPYTAFPYLYALNQVRQYYKRLFAQKREQIKQAGFDIPGLNEPVFFGLIGEYSFANFEPYFTPVEKDWSPTRADFNPSKQPPKVLTKSRSVIRILDTLARVDSLKGYFVRVSQISFKYCWQWLNLLRDLRDTLGKPPCQLYLSSGWESAILITYHNSNLRDAFDPFRLEVWQDIHSSFGVEYPVFNRMPSPRERVEEKSPSSGDTVCDMLTTTGAFVDVWDRTGRQDITVTWRAQDPITLIYDGFSRIPRDLWGKMTNITTSLAMKKAPSDADKDKEPIFVSQITLRHD